MPLSIRSLHIYPVKSCAGIGLDAAPITTAGLAFDRQWLVVSGGQFLTQRQHPRMALVRTALTDTHLQLRAPGMPLLEVPLDGSQRSQCPESVTVWRDTFTAQAESEDAAQWFSRYLGIPCRLLWVDVQTANRATSRDWVGRWREANPTLSAGFEGDHLFGFADGFPILVANQASLNELNRVLGAKGRAPVSMDRFRPNIVLDGDDLGAYEEDHLALLTCGEGVRLALVKPCTRCGIPDVDQESGERGDEPGLTLTATRSADIGVVFGQNAIVHAGAGARLRVGDPVTLEWAF
ncbi:MOSC domain-containing protein [Bordetella genomosp. 9]|uniref:MOSC domain-containing protein n=1 Tax=Bordetella genomosp. 9 TaxID=1416803 RepID=A0A1W6Z5T7_9BORD|nr:MOSC N-terminal beta barrel domain-containing protein [Bordetella genomosp. 9]ARP88732.1 MOSC domain-containing protein [Bordetella genomosp. 9]ARP92720.1 MOSC domain-containing protein [Bordetella genomosp. 9]